VTAHGPCPLSLGGTPPHALYLRGGPAATILYITDDPRQFESGLNIGYISASKIKFTAELIGFSTGRGAQFETKFGLMGLGIGQILLEVAHYNI
jgi:hypothetical protein